MENGSHRKTEVSKESPLLIPLLQQLPNTLPLLPSLPLAVLLYEPEGISEIIPLSYLIYIQVNVLL